MWDVRLNLPFDTRLKMTPFCDDWQSVCWVILRAHSIFEKTFIDRSLTYLGTLALMITIIYGCFRWYKSYRKDVPRIKIKALRERVQGGKNEVVNKYDTLNSTLDPKADEVVEPIARDKKFRQLMDVIKDLPIDGPGSVSQSETIRPIPVVEDVIIEDPPKIDGESETICASPSLVDNRVTKPEIMKATMIENSVIMDDRDSPLSDVEDKAAIIKKSEIMEDHGKRLPRPSPTSPTEPASPIRRNLERKNAQRKNKVPLWKN